MVMRLFLDSWAHKLQPYGEDAADACWLDLFFSEAAKVASVCVCVWATTKSLLSQEV